VNKSKNTIKEKLPVMSDGDNLYNYPSVEVRQINKVVVAIMEKIPEKNDKSLDQSILDAHFESILFLGKLEELDSIVKNGRKQVSQLVDNLLKKLSRESEDRVDQIQQFVQEFINNLSTDADKGVDSHMNMFTGQRFMEEMNRQRNDRLEIWSYAYFMTAMTRAISDKFVNKDFVDSDGLRSVGALFFDLDGLKFLNEVNCYNAGDKALWVMARALTDSRLTRWSEKQNIELVPTHHHGDEFLLGVVASNNIDLTDNKNDFVGVGGERIKNTSVIKYIGDYVTNVVNGFGQETEIRESDKRTGLTSGYAVSGSMGDVKKYKGSKNKKRVNPPRNIGDIINFSDSSQLGKLSELKAQLPEEERKLLDENFKYQLSCSYGYSVLEDSMAKNIVSKLGFDNSDISYEYIIYKLAVGLLDVSETKLKISKMIGREERNKSRDARLRLLEKLYRFGRKSEPENADMQKFYRMVTSDLIDLELRLNVYEEKMKHLKESNQRKKVELSRHKRTSRWRNYHSSQERLMLKRKLEEEIKRLRNKNDILKKQLELMN